MWLCRKAEPVYGRLALGPTMWRVKLCTAEQLLSSLHSEQPAQLPALTERPPAQGLSCAPSYMCSLCPPGRQPASGPTPRQQSVAACCTWPARSAWTLRPCGWCRAVLPRRCARASCRGLRCHALCRERQDF